MKYNIFVWSGVIFLISTSVSPYSYGTNVDQHFFIFEDKNKSVLSTEINYSRFAPVNQLNLNAMPIILDKVIKNIEKFGYVNNEVAKNSRHFEVISYGGTVKKIYFFDGVSDTPELFSEIYAANPKFNKIRSIRLNLSAGYNGNRFEKINIDTTIPMSLVSSLNIVDERKAKKVYTSLMNQHLLNIKNNVNVYCNFLVTTRVNVQDYWLEFNTERIKNNTYFNIYQSKGVPVKCGF